MLLGPLAVLVCQSNKTLPGHADGKTCYRMRRSEKRANAQPGPLIALAILAPICFASSVAAFSSD